MAVAAFVNPHDITGWPLPWLGGVQSVPGLNQAQSGDDVFQRIGALLQTPAPIPQQGERSAPPAGGTYQVDLNPQGFPQDNGILSSTWNSDLSTKPTCQYEASFKISQGFLAAYPEQLWQAAPLPYKSTKVPEAWLLSHLQIYIYFQYLVNLEIDKILSNMERNGLLDNTIIVFTSDHGEMGGAHGGQIEKWHNAYREAIHVPFIVSSPLVNASRNQMRDLHFVSSHVDLAPTLLGLAGYHSAEQSAMKHLILGHQVYDLPGRDLSLAIQREPMDTVATHQHGVLFVTQDDITLPTDRSNLPATFTNYLQIVEDAIAQGAQQTSQGPITQPNHVYAYCETEWKLVRYIDGRRSTAPSSCQRYADTSTFEPDQWELYDLKEDPEEVINLVSWRDGEPIPEPARIPSSWSLTAPELVAELLRLREALALAMARYGYAADGGPSSSPDVSCEEAFARFNFNTP
jgi:hypothetical protein